MIFFFLNYYAKFIHQIESICKNKTKNHVYEIIFQVLGVLKDT
jgi:hypothetical protein